MSRPRIYLIEGPVGAGKSTYAARLSLQHAAPHLNLDEWMVNLFRADRPADDFMAWYAERKDRCLRQIWHTVCSLVDSGHSVVLELGLVSRVLRDAFYQQVDAAGYELQVTVLSVPLDVRRARVVERNTQRGTTFQMEVSPEVFELANRAWEEPDEQEISARDIEFVNHG